jgi:hypothetical protein
MEIMPEKEQYDLIITAIMAKAMRIKLDIFESNDPFYILTSRNYVDLQEIKNLVRELEEFDSLSDNQDDKTTI